jgi:hypothetical protein
VEWTGTGHQGVDAKRNHRAVDPSTMVESNHRVKDKSTAEVEPNHPVEDKESKNGPCETNRPKHTDIYHGHERYDETRHAEGFEGVGSK